MYQKVYNRLMCTTTLIRFPKKQNQHATGFFYNYNGCTYLITNRHVLEHESDQPKEISIWFRDYSDVESTNREEVPLYVDESPQWLIHPIYPEADIAALPLNQRLSHVNDEERVTGSLALSSSVFAGPELLIRGGTGARVFGYPEGYVDTTSQFPIARKGMIASPYGNWFDEQPQFLVDGVMGDGMSGSPVFTERTNQFEEIDGDSYVAGASTFLIGIHSGDYWQADNAHDSDLNLNHVWYSELIEELLLLNGLSDYVETVEFAKSSEFIQNENSEKELSELISVVTNSDFFDPEINQSGSPCDALDEKIGTDELMSIVSLMESPTDQ